VPASPGVGRPVKYQAVEVHGYLGLDRVPFLLAAVVGPPHVPCPGAAGSFARWRRGRT